LNKQSQTKQDKLDKNSIKNVKPHEYNSGNQNLAYDFSEDSTEVSNRTTLTQKSNTTQKDLLVNNFMKPNNGAPAKTGKTFLEDADDDDYEDYDEEEDEEVEEKGIIESNIPSQEVHIEENDSEDEGIDDYRIGGYHPVHIGEVLQGRYVVIQKLGWGHFSTVWLCKDFKYDTYVAVKVQKSASNYMEAAYDEVEILQRVARSVDKPEWVESMKEYFKDENRESFTRDDCHVVQLLNSFIYQGPYGNHFCMVFEIMGVNLLEIIKRYDYKGIPMDLCRRMAKQILIGLDYLHRICGLIHTDLKPENILLCLTNEEIVDIVENGQLSKHKEYEQRIKLYQQKYGIKIAEQPAQPKRNKNQKKKDRKKKKAQEEKQKAAAEAADAEEDDLLKPSLRSRSFHPHPKTGSSMARYLSLPHLYDQEERKAEERAEIEANKNKENAAKGGEKKIIPVNPKEKLKPVKLHDDFKLKIVDLGNACWKHHHFSQEIQTRQYRSPEVIIGVSYNETADIWSFACTIFEMLTGDFLFEPKKGPNFGKDDDHLAQIIELVSKVPKNFALSGTQSKKFFDKQGNLRKIQGFHYWPLRNVLSEKYNIRLEEAIALGEFLKPMLNFYPHRRIQAKDALRLPWLSMKSGPNFKLTEAEIKKKMQSQGRNHDIGYSSLEEPETGNFQSDKEDNGSEASDFSDEPHDNYGYDDCLNNSFGKTGYIPYGGGINVEDLDQDPNWQFVDADKVLDE